MSIPTFNKRYRNHPVWVDGHIEWLTEAEHRAYHARQMPATNLGQRITAPSSTNLGERR